MKCESCEKEINPQWRHAIDANLCPFCGQPILPVELKDLLAGLSSIMDTLVEKYSPQLSDWLLSNHEYIKTTSPQLSTYLPKETLKEIKKIEDQKAFEEKKKFKVKVKTEDGVEEVDVEKIQSEETTNEFFARANVNQRTAGSPAENTRRIKDMVAQIKKTGSTSVGDFSSDEFVEEADPDAVAEFQAALSGGNEIMSSLSDGISHDDEIPAAALALANRAKPGQHNAADLMKLQQMELKRQQSRANFESGENRGKGGFSRA